MNFGRHEMEWDVLPKAPDGQTWVYLNYLDGPRWELRGIGAIFVPDENEELRQMETETVFRVGDRVTILCADSTARGCEGVVAAATRFSRLHPDPQSVRVRFLWPGSTVARDYRFYARELRHL